MDLNGHDSSNTISVWLNRSAIQIKYARQMFVFTVHNGPFSNGKRCRFDWPGRLTWTCSKYRNKFSFLNSIINLYIQMIMKQIMKTNRDGPLLNDQKVFLVKNSIVRKNSLLEPWFMYLFLDDKNIILSYRHQW
jgi:hypothetical protein